MKNIKIKLITIFGLTCLFASGVSAAREEAFMIRGMRPLAMGGAFTAVSDDANAFFYNPAGVAAAEKTQLTLLQLGLTIGDDLKKGYDWYKDNQDDLDNMDALKDGTAEEQARYDALMTDVINTVSKLRIAAAVEASQFSFLSPNHKLSYGTGLFTQANVLVNVNSGIIVPLLEIGRAHV